MKSMNAVNAVQLFILVWTFTAVCRADDDISVSCEDVTGTVGEEVTFSCSVSLKKSDCCIIKYKFLYPEKYKDSIYKEEHPRDSCEQRDISTCRFSSTTVMTGQFRFFVQTTCGNSKTGFTVDITETSKPETVSEDPGKKETSKPEPVPEDPGEPISDQSSRTAEGRGLKVAVIAAAVSCFIIVIIPIIYKMRQNYKQKRMFRDNNPVNGI